MTAAISARILGSRVLLIEKADKIGGTTAWSGGAAWLPGNPHMQAAGAADSPAAAATYIRSIVGDRFDPIMVDAFLKNAPRMVSFLETRTSAVRFQSYAGPDYHPELAGAASKARSVMPVEFDARCLGPLLQRMRTPMRELTVFGGMQVDPAEALHLQYSWKRWASFKIAAPLLLRYMSDRVRFGRSSRLIRGQALTARLLQSANDLGVELRTGVRATRLIQEHGRVVGAATTSAHGEDRILAARGVILASGGFSANADMIAQYFPDAAQHIMMMPDTNRGEGLSMAQAAGATLGPDNADNGIWMPASSHRRRDGTVARYPHFAFDRCKPGSMIVDRLGRRFVNEAASYHVVVRAMHAHGALPAWLIADHSFLRRYGMGIARPFPYPYRHFVKTGYLMRGSTLAALARKIGIDPAALEASVARLNLFAAIGEDGDFGKGGDMFTRLLGDAGHKPNPCLGPIQTGPFYALALYPSDCGTTLGLRTDANAQVLGASGEPIAGLYACGLDMNSVLRGHYPGAGSMLGPAMTFGYVAAHHIVGTPAAQESTP
jgi:hypothetical protein